jgi:hypothetical protein
VLLLFAIAWQVSYLIAIAASMTIAAIVGISTNGARRRPPATTELPPELDGPPDLAPQRRRLQSARTRAAVAVAGLPPNPPNDLISASHVSSAQTWQSADGWLHYATRGEAMRRTVLTVLLATGAAVAFAIPAQASAPALASGTFSGTDTLTPVRTTASGTTFYSDFLVGQYSGDLSGSFTDTGTFVTRADGSFFGYGTEVCTDCTLAGRVGDFTATYNLQGTATGTPSHGGTGGHLTFTSASDGLAGLHGQGAFTGAGTYSYSYSFAP